MGFHRGLVALTQTHNGVPEFVGKATGGWFGSRSEPKTWELELLLRLSLPPPPPPQGSSQALLPFF